MAEPKRYEHRPEGMIDDTGIDRGQTFYVDSVDYTILSREVERLRRVEVAAAALMDKVWQHGGDVKLWRALAEACGRKG